MAKDLHEVVLADETSLYELGLGDTAQPLSFGQGLQRSEVDGRVLYTVDVLEAELRQTTLDRHLTTFEADLLGVARAALSTLMTTRRGTPETRTWTTTDALTRLYRARGGLQT